jgi:glycolate oxidase FAD binding subunit
VLSVRLSGSRLGVAAARSRIGGDPVPDGQAFWRSVREQTLDAFRGPLWRLSIKASTPPLALPGTQVIEWNGSLRWVATEAPVQQLFDAARKAGGHATRFRTSNGTPVMRLDPAVLELHKRLKAALDPDGIFGPHRLHPEF